MPYIDALFFAAGASTQSGLNTIDVNTILLWQQMTLYIVATFTTPIFIHGSLLFIRLYYFERYFDNIKEISKLNHKMRRNATMGSRTRSNDTTGLNTMVNTGYNLGLSAQPTAMDDSVDPRQFQHGDGHGEQQGALHGAEHDTQHDTQHDDHAIALQDIAVGQDTASHSHDRASVEPVLSQASKADEKHSDTVSREKQSAESDSLRQTAPHIQFPGNLDHPSRHKQDHQLGTGAAPGDSVRFGGLKTRRDYEPSDMYRSIELLQQKKKHNDDDDDVLIIKSPNEIETDGDEHPIFTRKISFDHKLKPKFRHMMRNRLRRMRTLNTLEDESRSIDSDDLDGGGGSGSGIGSDSDELDHLDEPMRHTPSHLAVPGTDGSGWRHARRTQTLEPQDEPRRDSHRDSHRDNHGHGHRAPPRASTDDGSLFTSISRTLTNTITRLKTSNYLSWEPTIGRNSNFVHLTDEQKEELGGVEYRAIKLLIRIVWLYYVGLHLISMAVFLGWIMAHPDHQETLREYGVSPAWWGFFTAQTCFNDLGFTLNPNSLIDYNRSLYVMLWGAFFIIVGNTGFPVLLRFIIWVLYKFARPASLFEESLAFLLDHPRRCFTLLFPSGPTWWLFAVLVLLNGIDLVFFIILDLKNKYLEEIPTGYRVVCGLFNAVSTRTAGVSVIDLSQLHSAVQVSYMVMMYILVMPIAISIRRTNVYEEQSIGVYLQDVNNEDEKSPTNFIGNHLRNQLSFDLWFVFLGLFIICIAENSKLENDDPRFNVFTILFEVVSAYGTVGLSLGYPTANTSFSGQYTVISKLIVIAMMIRGRHRGLPYALDRAIMLPNDNMAKRDEVQQHHEMRRQETLERVETMVSGSRLFRALSRRGNDILRRRSTIATRRLSG